MRMEYVQIVILIIIFTLTPALYNIEIKNVPTKKGTNARIKFITGPATDTNASAFSIAHPAMVGSVKANTLLQSIQIPFFPVTDKD